MPPEDDDIDQQLGRAARDGDIERMQTQIDAGGDVAIAFAATAKHAQTIALEWLLENYPRKYLEINQLLMTAARFGALFTVDMLVKKYDADMFAQSDAAFNAAVMTSQEHVLEYLDEKRLEKMVSFREDVKRVPDLMAWLSQHDLVTGEAHFIRAVRMGCVGNVVEQMRQRGETFSLDHVTLTANDERKNTPFSLATTGELREIFSAPLWQGKPAIMRKAWLLVPEEKSAALEEKGFDFAGVECDVQQQALKPYHARPVLKRKFGA